MTILRAKRKTRGSINRPLDMIREAACSLTQESSMCKKQNFELGSSS